MSRLFFLRIRSIERTVGIVAVVLVTAGAAGEPPAPCSEQPPGPVGSPEVTPLASQPVTPKPRYRSRAKGGRPETDPPAYVGPLSRLAGLDELEGIDFGLEHQTRFVIHDDDYRRDTLAEDKQFLLRSRAYVGIREILDPFRFALEFQDARQFNSRFPETNRDVDEADFLQAFGELYISNALAIGYPLRLRAGRMSFDLLDRKLIARNRFRNTTNAFDGFRITAGSDESDWQIDFTAAQPVDRRMTRFDRPDEERWVYALVGDWRGLADWLILEPYYVVLDEDFKNPAAADREIHTLGVRAYGLLGDSGFDYDTNVVFQVGQAGRLDHCAFASFAEIGYRANLPASPRISFFIGYAGGDENPDDELSESFDRMYAAGHCASTSDLFQWQNIIIPKLRLELRPLESLRIEVAYGAYWLASDRDAWAVPRRRDPTGRSGDFVGQELDAQLRYELTKNIEIEIGYSHFTPGPFAKNTGSADDTNMFYVQTRLRL